MIRGSCSPQSLDGERRLRQALASSRAATEAALAASKDVAGQVGTHAHVALEQVGQRREHLSSPAMHLSWRPPPPPLLRDWAGIIPCALRLNLICCYLALPVTLVSPPLAPCPGGPPSQARRAVAAAAAHAPPLLREHCAAAGRWVEVAAGPTLRQVLERVRPLLPPWALEASWQAWAGAASVLVLVAASALRR